MIQYTSTDGVSVNEYLEKENLSHKYVYLMCYSGKRAAKAAEYLKNKGICMLFILHLDMKSMHKVRMALCLKSENVTVWQIKNRKGEKNVLCKTEEILQE